ncbi:PSP, partial [Symbiodinium microadriaticum]
MSEANARQLFRNAAAVCFDVDSTVSAEEGIDVLAGFAGRAAEVVELTSRAMGGAMSFEDALAARLNIIRPSYKMIHDCLAAHPVKLSPKVSELIQKLHDRGTYVFLISGGFHQMIHPVADAVSVPYHRIFANSIMFTGPDGRGEYSGYDTKQFTCRDGGKARAVQHIKDEFGVTGSIVV